MNSNLCTFNGTRVAIVCAHDARTHPRDSSTQARVFLRAHELRVSSLLYLHNIRRDTVREFVLVACLYTIAHDCLLARVLPAHHTHIYAVRTVVHPSPRVRRVMARLLSHSSDARGLAPSLLW